MPSEGLHGVRGVRLAHWRLRALLLLLLRRRGRGRRGAILATKTAWALSEGPLTWSNCRC